MTYKTVSYTHLDVYKRQPAKSRRRPYGFEQADALPLHTPQYGKLLLSGCGRKGALSLIHIYPDYHGQGIGRELFSRFCVYMERENIQHFYVFTDTSCNYGFYENMNMFRRGTKRVKLKVNHRLEEFSFFLYENREH